MALFGVVGAIRPVDAQRVQPQPVHRTQPIFPYLAYVQGLTGYAVAEFTITERGDTKDIRIVEANHKDFWETTVDCVAGWRFTPATINRKPVAVRVRQRLDFTREGEIAVLETRSFNSFQLDLNDDWTVWVTEAEEATDRPSMVRVYKEEVRFEIKTTAAGKAELLEDYARRVLELRNQEAELVDGHVLYDEPPKPESFQREVAGEYRQGFRVRIKLVDQRGGLWMLFEIFRFAAGDRDYQILVSYPTESSVDDILTLGAILKSLNPELQRNLVTAK